MELVLHLVSEVLKVVFEFDNAVVFAMDFLLELFPDLLSHVALHQVVMVFQGPQFSIGDIELVNHLVALG